MNEAIFAVATSIQRSALHLHRLSGNGIFDTLLPYLKTESGKQFDLQGSNFTTQSSHFTAPQIRFPFTQYLHIFDAQNDLIDDVIITFFRAPKSYTGEDLIEISCHGNPLISQKLQSFFRSIGFRDAREGEFTSRAFLNGKLDLAQAEAIKELIHAETHAGIQLSRNQLNGALSAEINSLREKFTDILSYLEAHIDFAPDEVGNYEPTFLVPKLKYIYARLKILKHSYADGMKIKEGLKIVLSGKPNVGKSTLYNKLLNSDCAIVTEIAGTTRDVLSERLVIESRDFILMDTAGLRETKNTVEQLGVARSLKALQEADIICTVIDGSKPLPRDLMEALAERQSLIKPQEPLTSAERQSTIFIISKTDLMKESKKEKIAHEFHKHYPNNAIVFVSQHNIDDFKLALMQKHDEWMAKNNSQSNSSPILISTRSHDKVQKAMMVLDEVFVLLENKDLPEKIASNVYYALKTLEEILGEVDLDKVYQKIFSTFCIGK